jgi:hypothetical protein
MHSEPGSADQNSKPGAARRQIQPRHKTRNQLLDTLADDLTYPVSPACRDVRSSIALPPWRASLRGHAVMIGGNEVLKLDRREKGFLHLIHSAHRIHCQRS